MGAGIAEALRGVGKNLGASEIQQIANDLGVPVSRVADKASSMGISMGGATQNVVSAAAAPPTPPGGGGGGGSGGGGSGGGGGGGGFPLGGGSGITIPEFQAAQTAAELQTRSQISNYGWDTQKAMETIRQAGQTERNKYEVDNRIPVVQAEAKGRIDLQKIVNAGMENVTRIERGADMMRSITSMFNF